MLWPRCCGFQAPDNPPTSSPNSHFDSYWVHGIRKALLPFLKVRDGETKAQMIIIFNLDPRFMIMNFRWGLYSYPINTPKGSELLCPGSFCQQGNLGGGAYQEVGDLGDTLWGDVWTWALKKAFRKNKPLHCLEMERWYINNVYLVCDAALSLVAICFVSKFL